MGSTHWWLCNAAVLAIRLMALAFYALGSWRWYWLGRGFLWPIGAGIIADGVAALTASCGWLPIMTPGQSVPWGSVLFLLHIIAASLGMFGFVGLFFYVILRGRHRHYPSARVFQYRVLLPIWCGGIAIAVVNFVVKITAGVRIYDYW